MKKIIVLSLALLFFVGSTICAHAKDMKIAYMDLDSIFEEYNKTKEEYKSLDDKLKQKEGERKKMVDEIRRMKDELDLLSDKGKEEKQTAIDEKINTLSDFDKKAKDEFKKARMNAIKDISSEIDVVIQDYCKKEGYDYVFSSRAMVYAKEEFDITNAVLKILNGKTAFSGGKKQ